MPNISVEDLERAVGQLGRSEKGQRALGDLLAFLEDGGISLDEENQRHFFCLLSGAWGSYAGTTLEALRAAVKPQDDLALVEVAAA